MNCHVVVCLAGSDSDWELAHRCASCEQSASEPIWTQMATFANSVRSCTPPAAWWWTRHRRRCILYFAGAPLPDQNMCPEQGYTGPFSCLPEAILCSDVRGPSVRVSARYFYSMLEGTKEYFQLENYVNSFESKPRLETVKRSNMTSNLTQKSCIRTPKRNSFQYCTFFTKYLQQTPLEWKWF